MRSGPICRPSPGPPPTRANIVLLTTNTHDVLTFDLQESVAQSLLNLNVPAPKSK